MMSKRINAYTVYQGDMPEWFLRTCGFSWKQALAEYMGGPGRALVGIYREYELDAFWKKMKDDDAIIEMSKAIFVVEHNHEDNMDYLHRYDITEGRWVCDARGPCSVSRHGEELEVDADLQC